MQIIISIRTYYHIVIVSNYEVKVLISSRGSKVEYQKGYGVKHEFYTKLTDIFL